MAYFSIMAELRGCYSDNESMQIIRADTRKELKAHLESECYYLRDAGAIGLNKRAIAWLANAAWKARKNGNPYPFVAPYKFPYQSGYAMGLMVNAVSRAEYKEYCESCD